jgi:hypothetical protein
MDEELLLRAEPRSSLAGGDVVDAIQELDLPARAFLLGEEEAIIVRALAGNRGLSQTSRIVFNEN